MNRKQFDLGLLVTVACMFTVSVGLLHGRKNNNPTMDQPIALSVQDTIDIITPSLLAEDIASAIAILKELKSENITDVLRDMVDNKGPSLSDDAKAILIINMLPVSDSSLRKDIFTLLLRTTTSKPFFYLAQTSHAEDAIPLLVSLSKDNNIYHDVMMDSYIQAVTANDVDTAQKLYSLSIRPDKTDSGNLLIQAIEADKDIAFVSLFIQKLMVDPDFSPDGKRTLLMHAVENNSEPMVRALLEVGAHPDKILDDAVGSARQIAYERKFTNLEPLLINTK